MTLIMPQLPDLVIFDCDGVLVDTEQMSNDCMAEFFTENGLEIDGFESRKLFQGWTLEDVAKKFASLTGQPYDPAMGQTIRDRVEARVANGVKAVDGVVELVKLLQSINIPMCVASSGSIAKMQSTLGQAGLLDFLGGHLFSAQDEGRGKPHPDVFIRAAKSMGHACNNAAVIEDSRSGVIAGVASGAQVFGYTGDAFTDAQELKTAGATLFGNMSDIPELIGLAI